MRVWIFKGQSGVHGLTKLNNQSVLPAELGPWQLIRDIELESGEERIAIDTEKACADIQDRGFHVASPWIRIPRAA